MKDSLKNKIQRLHTMVGAVVLMLGIAVSVQAGATDRDLLRFLDGSMLHGRLEEVQAQGPAQLRGRPQRK